MSFNVFKDIVYVRYLDHVQYSRAPALVMSPQTRETIGWLVYECDQYINISHDRDAGPPTITGGDPKASGLVILKSDIVDLQKPDDIQILQEPELHLNSQKHIQQTEYALQFKQAKNSNRKRRQQ